MSSAEKEAVVRDRAREPAISCPHCETRTTVDDLLSHIDERCPGMGPPHPRSRWVRWSDALRLGATRASMHAWVAKGLVRAKGRRPRRYLLRDVVKMVARRKTPHCRES